MDDREKNRRLFVGIELDDATRAACGAISHRLQLTGFDAKYESLDKLHVTIAFLGLVGTSRSDAIAAALDRTAAANAPFELTLDKLGGFPHEGKPRVVLIGAREHGAPFREVAGAVRAAYAASGFIFAGDPVAHVTIARVKEPRCALRPIEFEPIVCEVGSLSLFESVFDPQRKTSRYSVAHASRLSQRES